MGYVDSNLIAGETVVFSVKLHKIVFLWPGIFAIPLFTFSLWLIFQEPYAYDATLVEISRLERLTGLTQLTQLIGPIGPIGSIGLTGLTGLCFLSSLAIILPTFLRYHNSEFAVTNKRIIVKTGYLFLRTIEILLQKIEAIEVSQDIFGKLCNYGTITVIGTGGTNESFCTIGYPLAFRRAIEMQADARGREWSIDQE
jgi:hypothetical protein